MKFLTLLVVYVAALVVPALDLSAKGSAGGGEWVRVPDAWLLTRFVRVSTTPAKEYRVAIAIPAGSNLRSVTPKIVTSSGINEVDKVAADYARDLAQNTSALRGLVKSRELYFQLKMTPPALDINLRSELGRRPIPAGMEVSTPVPPSISTSNSESGGVMNKTGELVVVFPPGGGHASWALIPVSTDNRGADRFYIYNAVLNWQTTRKASQEQALKHDIGVRRPTHQESILDP